MLNIRRSLRSLASRPVFPVVAVATLALGLGVNAAIFSLTREVLLRPLPYRDADRLVRVFEVSRALGVASAPIAPVNYIAWRDLVDAFEQTAVFRALLRAPASSERACPESLERDRLSVARTKLSPRVYSSVQLTEFPSNFRPIQGQDKQR